MNIAGRVYRLWRRLSFRLLPGCCVQCGGASGRGLDLCASCEAELPWNSHCCQRCALPLAGSAPRCGRCQKAAPEFDAAHCPFRYEWPLNGLITRFKFGADLAAGKVLADVMAYQLAKRLGEVAKAHSPLLIPVPLHSERLRERGFNQALELARPLADALRIELCADGLSRDRATQAQTGLNALHRRRNVRGAFVANAKVQGRHVLIVDDVITTAATVRECTKVLKRAGAASVVVCAMARAPEKSHSP